MGLRNSTHPRRALSIVQLPFPSLNYFPEPEYFRFLERWYRQVVSPECTVPFIGIWEVPPWITWVRAALRAATGHTPDPLLIQAIDLSRTVFDLDAVIEDIRKYPQTDIYCFSPLTQNSGLTTQVSILLRQAGRTVVAGGPVVTHLDSKAFDSLFVGRIEFQLQSFLY